MPLRRSVVLGKLSLVLYSFKGSKTPYSETGHEPHTHRDVSLGALLMRLSRVD